MKLSDFIKSKQKKEEPKNAQEAFDTYSKMNNDDLHKELLKQGSVKNGKTKPEDLDNFYNNAKNYLTKEQSEKMAKLIEELKNN